MLQRGNSDAAKRLRKTKAGREPPPRERPFVPTSPAQLHEQAVVAAVRAHEVAYGQTRTSMEEDRASRASRPSLERQGSHIARHLSNASSKSKTNRPKPVRRKTSKMRSEDMNFILPPSTPAAIEAQHNPFNTIVGHTDQAHNLVSSPASTVPSRSRLGKKSSKILPQATGSAVTLGQYDTVRHVDGLPSTSMHVAGEPERRVQNGPLSSGYLDGRERPESQGQHPQELSYSPSLSNLSFISKLSRSKQRQQTGEVPVLETVPPTTTSKSQSMWKSTKGNTLKKSRRVSISFTNTIKKAFGKRSSSPALEIPPQQVQAHRPHYGSESTSASRRMSISTLNLDAEDEHAFGQSRSQTPAFIATSSRNASSQQSASSSDGSLNNRSRVTSWMTSSSKENTMRIHQREPHLPQIDESPVHTPSATASQSLLNESRVPSLRVEEPGPPDERPRLGHDKVDGRRLLSALRTHMAEEPRRHQQSSDARNVSGSTTRSWQSSDRLTDRSKMYEDVNEEPVQMSANITDFSSDFPFDVPMAPDDPLPYAHREGMVSPSIYSARPGDGRSRDTLPVLVPDTSQSGHNYPTVQDVPISLPQRATSSAGTAYVSDSHQVSRWSLPVSSSPSKPYPNTSGEWRSWAADELADLETAVSGPEMEAKHKPNNPFARKAERRASTNIDQGKLKSNVEGSTDGRLERPKLLGTQSDSMNERFPMLPLPQRSKRPSPASSRKTSSTSKTSLRIKDEDDDAGHTVHYSSSSLRAESAAVPKKRSNLALHVTSASDVTPTIPPRRPRSSKEGRAARLARREMQLKEQPSLAGLLAEEQTREAERVSPRSGKGKAPAPMDESFLLRIRKGPYSAAGGSSSPARSSQNGSVDSFDLLSRRIGTGVGGLVKGLQMRGGHDENARPSPTKGQVMMDDFLGKRLSRAWREIEEDGEATGQGSSPRFL